jgi:hypothetical protein
LSEHFYQPVRARLAPDDTSQADNALKIKKKESSFLKERSKELLILRRRRTPSLRALAKQSRATQRSAGRVTPGLLRKSAQ